MNNPFLKFVQNRKKYKSAPAFIPDESTINETHSVFQPEIYKLINKINKYWYNNKNPKTARIILKEVLNNITDEVKENKNENR